MFKKSLSLLSFNARRSISSQKMQHEFDWAKHEKILMEPFEYVKKVPNKHHEMMGPVFNHWLQVPEEKLNGIIEVSDSWIMFNTLLDDIQDDSAFRHGVSAAHLLFGVGVTINAAVKGFMLAQRQIQELGHPLGLEVLMKRQEEYCQGQGIDLYWRDHCICPTEEAHIEMTAKKSGACFVVPVELMQLFSNNKTDYTNLAIDIGVYYELLDDYYNFFQPKALSRLASIAQENHSISSDITDGKIILSVIHAMQFPDVASELAGILKQRTSDPKLQNRVISLLKKHGSDEYTRNKLKSLEAKMRKEIDQLGGNPKLTAFLDDLSFQNYQLPQEEDIYR